MAQRLSEAQTAALFDILSHYDTYAEIRDFRHPKSLLHYGPPFTHEANNPSTSPALQSLVSRFLLNLPGLRDLPPEFWKVQCHDIIESFEAAELSESYDKGVIGSRKTLATAISALIEYPVRGTYGGFAKVEDADDQNYDLNSAEDLSRAFRDFMDQCVYGDVIQEVVQTIAETDQLSDHPPLTRAVHEFILVNLASLMHYTLILTPKGQYLVKLIDNVNKLIPYLVVRQTLKIGNVASMINAMVKVVLAKMSIASFTNWMGLTATEDEGMNLLQQIISSVLTWDNKDLESRASRIEKDKSGLTKEQLEILKGYQNLSRDDHEKIRKISRQESISIVSAIFRESSSPEEELSETMHKTALEYLSVLLSIRDRKEIVRILCHSTPDHLTTSIRSLVSAYEPVIRDLHKAVDLSDSMYDLEVFLRDLLKLSRVQASGKDGKSVVPTVGDFVQLLKKHQASLHKFMHQVCKNGPELMGWYVDWARTATGHFKRHEQSETEPKTSRKVQTGAGDLTEPLNVLFNKLPQESKDKTLSILDQQIKYINEMHAASTHRLASVVQSAPSKHPAIAKVLASPISATSSRQGSRSTSPAPPLEGKAGTFSPDPKAVSIDPQANAPKQKPSGPPPAIDSDPGPGAFLARWQDLLEATPITPSTAKGEVRHAASKEVVQESATDVDGEKQADFPDGKGGAEKVAQKATEDGKRLKKPDVRLVIDQLGDDFRKLLAEKSIYW